MFDRTIVERMLLKDIPSDCKCEFVDYQPLVDNNELEGYVSFIEDLQTTTKSSFTDEVVTSILLDFIKKMKVNDVKFIRDSLTIQEFIDHVEELPIDDTRGEECISIDPETARPYRKWGIKHMKYKFKFRCKFISDK
jgi:hypothetical protein